MTLRKLNFVCGGCTGQKETRQGPTYNKTQTISLSRVEEEWMRKDTKIKNFYDAYLTPE